MAIETLQPEPVTPVNVPSAVAPTTGSMRDTVLAELEALGDEPDMTDPAPTGEEQSANGTDESDNGTDEDAETTGDGETGDSEEQSAIEPEPEPTGIDPKKLEALNKQEKRLKDSVAQATRELEQREQAFTERQKAYEQRITRLETLEKRAAYDPVAVFEELGVKPEHFEDIAREFYARRPGAEADPANRAKLANKETADTVKALQEELRGLRDEIKQKETQQEIQSRAKAYQDAAAKLVDDDTPIVAKMLAKNPQKFRDAINATAGKLWRETGETPDHLDVVRELENSKRVELEELGIELPQKGNPKQVAQSPKTSAGTTLTNDLGNPTKPRTDPLSREELREDVLSNLSTGNFEI